MMLFPEKLYKVEIRVKKDPSIIEALKRFGKFHVELGKESREAKERGEVTAKLRELEIAMSKAGIPQQRPSNLWKDLRYGERKPALVSSSFQKNAEELGKLLGNLSTDLEKVEAIPQLSAKRESLRAKIANLKQLLAFDVDLGKVKKLKYVAAVIYNVDEQDAKDFEDEVKKQKIIAVRKRVPDGKDFLYLVFGESNEKLAKLKRLVKNVRVLDAVDGTPKEMLRLYSTELEKTNTEISKLQKIKAELVGRYADRLYALREDLQLKIEDYEVLEKLEIEGGSYVVRGFVAKGDYKELETILKKQYKGEYELTNSESGEDSPTKLKNPWFLQPFETLINLYGLPKPNELNPTPFFAFTFLMFFGIMYGDIGDAFIIASISGLILLRIKRGGARDIAKLAFMMACAGIVGGYLFGEIFAVSFHPVIENSFEAPVQFLYMVLGIGVVHLTIGYLLGMVNHAIRERHEGLIKIIFSGQLAYLIVMAAIAMFFIGPKIAGVILLVTGLAVLVKAEGFISLPEITKIVSNFFSYSRLLAYNMAHVGVGKAFLSIAALAANSGFFGILLAVLSVALSHTITLTIAALGSLVHDLRLHFVEFFPKVYLGEGKPFKPLMEYRIHSMVLKEVKNGGA